MKMKRICKKIIARVLTTVMLVSVFSTVDMGWNVMEVKAATYYTWHMWAENLPTIPGGLKPIYKEDIFIYNQSGYSDDHKYNKCMYSFTYRKTNGYATDKADNYTVEKNVPFSLPIDCYCVATSNGSNSSEGYIWFSFDVYPHKYGGVSYNWSNDGKSCTASRTCANSSNHKETAIATTGNGQIKSSVIVSATCTNEGKTRYTASFSSPFSTQTKEVFDIPKSGHTFSYSNSGNVITAKCSRSGCPYNTKGVTLTLSPNNNLTYDGKRKSAIISDWSVNNPKPEGLVERPTQISYVGRGDNTSYSGVDAPINVGEYTASITAGEKTANVNFDISKATIDESNYSKYFTVTTPNNVTYDRQSHAASVSANSGITGYGDSIKVEYQKLNGTEWEEATDEEPVDAGTYRVLLSVLGGENVNAINRFDVKKQFTINKATPTLTLPTASEITYGDSLADSILSGGEAKSNEYTVDGTFAWTDSTKIPTIAEGQGCSVTFTPTDSDNYNSKECTVRLTVNQAERENAPEDGIGYILNYIDETMIANPNADYEISSKNDPVAESLIENKVIPNNTYYIRYRQNDNQTSSPWRAIKLDSRPEAPVVSKVVERTDVTDDSITLQMIQGVEYSIDGTNYYSVTNEGNHVTVIGGNITFSYLDPETPYIVYSRVEATNDAPDPHFHGEVTEQHFLTKKTFPKNVEDRKNLFEYSFTGLADSVYDGQAKILDVKLKESTSGIGKPVVKYYDVTNGTEVDEPINAGTYTVKVTTLPTDDYPALSPELELGPFTIGKREITISGVNAKDKEYDGTDVVEFDYNDVVYAGIIEGDQLSVTATGNFNDANVKTGKPVTINLNGYTLGGNDVANYVLADSGHQSESSADIIQREVVLSWTDLEFDYLKNTPRIPSATVSNLVSGEECNVTVKLVGATEAINAGNYTAKATELTGDDSSNYKLSTDTTKTAKAFTINKINQPADNITFSMVSEYYYMDGALPGPSISGYEENPTITYYYSLKNQNTGGTILKNSYLGPMALEPDTYYLYAVLGTTTNYKEYITDPVLFRVKGQDISDRVSVDNINVTYTGKKEHGIKVNAPAGAKIMYGTTEGNYTLSTCPTYKDVGEHSIFYKVTMTGCDPVEGRATVTITRASLYVTPSPQTKVYGEDDPVFTYTVDGLLGTDTASVVSGTIEREPGEDVIPDGGYSFLVNDLRAKNYTVQCKPDVAFEITPKTLTADMVALRKWKYTHTGNSIDVTTDNNITLTYKGLNRTLDTDYKITDGSIKTAEGNYKVTIEGKGNFQGTIEKDWKIIPKVIVPNISADAGVTVTYGEKPTIEIQGIKPGDKVTYGDSENPIDKPSLDEVDISKDAGTYNIYYKVERDGGDTDYEPFESYVQLVIVPKPVGITWGDTNLIYNGKKQAPTATANADDLIGTDTCEVVTSSDAKNVGGPYVANAVGLSNKNYVISSSSDTTTTFTITPKSIIIKAKNVSKYVNAADPELTYEAAGLCEGDTLSGITLTRDEGESVGTYKITVTVDSTKNTNYSIEAVPGTFTITNRSSSNNNPKGDGPDGSDDSEGSDPSSPWSPLPKNEKPAEEKKPSDGLPKQIVKDNTKKDGDKKETDKDLNSSDKLDDGKDTNGDDGLKKYEDVKDEPVVENDKIKYGDGNISIVIDGDNQPAAGGDKPGTPEGALNVNVKSLEELIDTVLTDEEKERVKNGEEVTIRIFGEEKIPSEEAKTAVEECIKNGKIPFDLGDGKSAEVGMHFGKTINIKVMKKLDNGDEVEVTDWNGKMTVTVDIPKDLIADGRNYYVIAYVNGEAKRIAATVNADNTITFEAEEGAEYAICYIDESEIPLFDLGLHKGRHHLLWLYLVLLLLFFVARAITKEKANAVKISLFAGDVVVAGLLLFVVKICLLSVIVCFAEIAIALAIHLKMKG